MAPAAAAIPTATMVSRPCHASTPARITVASLGSTGKTTSSAATPKINRYANTPSSARTLRSIIVAVAARGMRYSAEAHA